MHSPETQLPTFPDFIFHHDRDAKEMKWQFNLQMKCSDGKYYLCKINKTLGYDETKITPEFVVNRFWSGFIREAQYQILTHPDPIDGMHCLDLDQTPEHQRLIKS